MEQASRQLRQQSVLRAAGITAGCSFGILVAVIAAVWFYLPSKSEMETLRAERAQLQASIEDLIGRGGRLTHTLCGDPKRFCVLIPVHAMTWSTDNKETVHVVPVGY